MRTTRERFTDDEWARVVSLPGLVLMAAGMSDGKRLPALRELAAGSAALTEGIDRYPHNAVLQAMTSDAPRPRHAGGPTGAVGGTAAGTTAGTAGVHTGQPRQPGGVAGVVDLIAHQIEPGVALLRERVTPEEFGQVSEVLSGAARAIVERLGGGFLGTGGPKVSASEQAFLDRLDAIFS